MTHYFWLFDTLGPDTNPGRSWEIGGIPPKGWIRKVDSFRRKSGYGLEALKYPETFEMITDAIYSEQPTVASAEFGMVKTAFWNKWQIPHRSNHMLGGDHPVGGNIFFVDGHASWCEFGNMWPDKTQPQQPRSMDWNQTPYFWW